MIGVDANDSNFLEVRAGCRRELQKVSILFTLSDGEFKTVQFVHDRF